jgi:hypothetical protein
MKPEEHRAIWFVGNHCRVIASTGETGFRIELLGPPGALPSDL